MSCSQSFGQGSPIRGHYTTHVVEVAVKEIDESVGVLASQAAIPYFS